MSMTANLTEKEMDLLYYIALGMDEYGSGWLDEIAALMWQDGIDWPRNFHAVAGVLGSLKGKGLIWSDVDRRTTMSGRRLPDAYWVQISDR